MIFSARSSSPSTTPRPILPSSKWHLRIRAKAAALRTPSRLSYDAGHLPLEKRSWGSTRRHAWRWFGPLLSEPFSVVFLALCILCFGSFVRVALLGFCVSFNPLQVGPDTLLKPPQPQGKGFQKQSSIKFSFDASYSSMDDAKPLATQTMLFDNVGRFALDNALKGECRVTDDAANVYTAPAGYNVSMFAYGQTGTGTCTAAASRKHPAIINPPCRQDAQHDRPPRRPRHYPPPARGDFSRHGPRQEQAVSHAPLRRALFQPALHCSRVFVTA